MAKLSADLQELLGQVDAKLGPMTEDDARALIKDLEDAIEDELGEALKALARLRKAYRRVPVDGVRRAIACEDADEEADRVLAKHGGEAAAL